MHRGDLYRRTAKGFRFVQAEKVRISIVKGLHIEIGHCSFASTYKIISDRFCWPKIWIDVAHFVRSCDSCQKANPSEQNGLYGRMPFSRLFHTWSIYFAGPLKETAAGNKYILLAVDNLSSWPLASATGTNYFNSSVVIKLSTVWGPDTNLERRWPKFDSTVVRHYAAGASIDWKII